MNTPLVSVICLCYDQAAFIEEALTSVWNQTYENIELIIVDDASTDGGVEVINRLTQNKEGVQLILQKENTGNCRAFNSGLALAKGKYIIDLAADDVLCSERVARGVKVLEAAGETYGVHFTDAEFIDERSENIGYHYKRNAKGELLSKVPEGDVYKDVLARYFVCTPSMMMRKSVMDELHGYDESLAYEDFDFWIRSARNHFYAFTDEVLVRKRILSTSLSKQQYEKNSPQLLSTYLVCEKAWGMNRSKQEDLALARRIRYELRQAVISGNFETARKFSQLLERLSGVRLFELWMKLLIRMRLNLSFVRRWQK